MPIRHRVKHGETIVALADLYGFLPETIWDAPENAKLRENRATGSALLPGDILMIPDKQLGEADAAVDQRHRFRHKGIPAKLRVQILVAGKPRANEPFRLVLEGFERPDIEGTTDGNGIVEAGVPTNARQITLWLGDDAHPHRLEVGGMDPCNEPSGVAKRLVNLGHLSAAADFTNAKGGLSQEVRHALARFQMLEGLEPTGELDERTEAALTKVHDTKDTGSAWNE